MAFTEKYIQIVIIKNMWKRLGANVDKLIEYFGHEHCANSVGIASSDHTIYSLQFAAAYIIYSLQIYSYIFKYCKYIHRQIYSLQFADAECLNFYFENDHLSSAIATANEVRGTKIRGGQRKS